MARKLGIQPYALALVHVTVDTSEETGRHVYQADRPSYYAEAILGTSSRKVIASELEKLTAGIQSGRITEDLPFFTKWLAETGKLTVENLEEKLRDSDKKCSNLVTQEAVQSGTFSNQGTLVYKVKSRTTGVEKDTTKFYSVTLANFDLEGGILNPNFSRSTTSAIFGKLGRRKRLWMSSNGKERQFLDEMIAQGLTSVAESTRELIMADYSMIAAATQLDLAANHDGTSKITNGSLYGRHIEIPFNFHDKWGLVFETFTRRYVFNQPYYKIDCYLFDQPKEIITSFFRNLMNTGIVHKEVIRQSRHFEGIGLELLKKLHWKLYTHQYRFDGCAREFVGIGNKRKQYDTIALVYAGGGNGHSIHVVYDNTFYIPFIVEKRLGIVTDVVGHAPYKNNPVRLLINRKSWSALDDRTDAMAEFMVHTPSADILSSVRGAKSKYSSYLAKFK